MDRTERFYKMIRMLRLLRFVTKAAFMRELGISRSQFTKDLAYLRDRMDAPIMYDPECSGYRLQGDDYELPGLWFNPSEIHALLAMQHLLSNLEPGILGEHIAPLRNRLERLLGMRDAPIKEVHKRLRLLSIANRPHNLKYFQVIAMAVIQRRRLSVTHFSRQRNERSQRELSPQRLVHYRDNWYLDAWCHTRNGLRSFSVDAIEAAEMISTRAKIVADRELDRVLTAGYGIFSGADVRLARLRFTAERARWVSKEQWHPEQKAHFEPDGRYVLEVPYSDDRELVMDVLKYGPDVEVLGPPELRQRAAELLRSGAAQY